MSVSKASMDRYSDPTFVGAYVEAEWGDKLDVSGSIPSHPSDVFDPPCFSTFYKEVAEFAQRELKNQTVETACDIGCSIGRFLYEFCIVFPDVKDLVGVEPSEVFTDYARKFLLRSEKADIRWIPLPQTQVTSNYVPLNETFLSQVDLGEKLRKRVEIVTGLGENTPRPDGYFDALFCLNVIDRHPNPKALVRALERFLKTEGRFFLASPMDWDERFTDREYWVDDLAELFSKAEWEKQAETNLRYPFRYALRHQNNYVSQVVCMKRNPTTSKS